MDERFQTFAQSMDERFHTFEQSMDERFQAAEKSIENKIDVKLQNGISGLRTELNDKIDRVALKVVQIEERLQRVEENMLTKEDGRQMYQRMDFIIDKLERMDHWMVQQNATLLRHDQILKDHFH